MILHILYFSHDMSIPCITSESIMVVRSIFRSFSDVRKNLDREKAYKLAGNQEVICLSQRKISGNAYKSTGIQEFICLSLKQSDANPGKPEKA